MDNQHREIKGYRDLNADEIAAMNNVKSMGEQLGILVQQVRAMPEVDQRWASIGATELQQGLMALTRAIAKPTFFALALALMVGCSGGKYHQSWPMESRVNGTTYHYHNAVQLNLPATMFHATQSMNWMEWCKSRIEDPQTEAEFLYPFQDCVRDDKYQLSTMGSVASQFVTPVLTTSMYAGALAYGLHQVGRGLGKSGDNVTQQGGGAQSEATAQGGAGGAGGKGGVGMGGKGGNGGSVIIKKH